MHANQARPPTTMKGRRVSINFECCCILHPYTHVRNAGDLLGYGPWYSTISGAVVQQARNLTRRPAD